MIGVKKWYHETIQFSSNRKTRRVSRKTYKKIFK
jgi:hypothetical protein